MLQEQERVNIEAVMPDLTREVVREYIAETGTPGLSLAVKVQDSPVLADAFGMADVAQRSSVDVLTRFRVGSISKTLTSAAVGLLYEQGRLDLDAPVQAYVPSFPEKLYPISTRQLAGHLSGLPHYADNDFINLVHYDSVTSALDKFKHRPLLFKPGERYHYSSFGYNLIAAVVEGAAGIPFLDFMQTVVFAPLGMTNTEADHSEGISPHRTKFYEVTGDKQPGDAPFTDNSDVWAAGGFLSTPKDLVAFGSELIDGRLLKPETLDLLFRPMRTSSGEVTQYGVGWLVYEINGHRVVGHHGGHFGASASLLVFPALRTVVAVAGNVHNEMFYGMAERIAEQFLP